MSKKKDTSRLTEFGLVRKIGAIDNPILRHFIKNTAWMTRTPFCSGSYWT